MFNIFYRMLTSMSISPLTTIYMYLLYTYYVAYIYIHVFFICHVPFSLSRSKWRCWLCAALPQGAAQRLWQLRAFQRQQNLTQRRSSPLVAGSNWCIYSIYINYSHVFILFIFYLYSMYSSHKLIPRNRRNWNDRMRLSFFDCSFCSFAQLMQHISTDFYIVPRGSAP
jgi:hypothetical protein